MYVYIVVWLTHPLKIPTLNILQCCRSIFGVWHVTQRRLIITDVSEERSDSILRVKTTLTHKYRSVVSPQTAAAITLHCVIPQKPRHIICRRIKDQLDVTCYFISFHFLCTQHVSGINIAIIRSLRLFCWITTLVVLFLVRCVGDSVLQASANRTKSPTHSEPRTKRPMW